MDTPNVITWLKRILDTKKSRTEKSQMKRNAGSVGTTKTFMNRLRTISRCPVCNTTYYEGALDFLSDEISCPNCSNGKDNDETSIRHRD